MKQDSTMKWNQPRRSWWIKRGCRGLHGHNKFLTLTHTWQATSVHEIAVRQRPRNQFHKMMVVVMPWNKIKQWRNVTVQMIDLWSATWHAMPQTISSWEASALSWLLNDSEQALLKLVAIPLLTAQPSRAITTSVSETGIETLQFPRWKPSVKTFGSLGSLHSAET